MKQPTADARTQALLQAVSAIGQSAAAAMRLTMSVAGQSPAARSAIRPATAASPPAPRPAAVYEQPSSRATAFDHSSRTAAGSPLRGQSAAGPSNSAAKTAPIPPPLQQAAGIGGGAATAAVSAPPDAASRQQGQAVISARPLAACAAKDLSRSSSGGGSRAPAASEPAKPGGQTQPSVTAAVSGLATATRSAATPAIPTQNGDSMPPGLAQTGIKLRSGPSAVQPSAPHVRARSGAVAAEAAERTPAAALSSLAAACGATAMAQPRADQPPGLGTGHWSLIVAADPRPPVFTNPAHPDAYESRALEPAQASDSTSLAAACADTTARAGEDGAGALPATAAVSPTAKQRAQQGRVLDVIQGRCDRSAEDVEKQRRTAITRTNDHRRAEGLQVRLGLQSSPQDPCMDARKYPCRRCFAPS